MRGFHKVIFCLPLVLSILLWGGCGNEGNEDTDTASSVWFGVIECGPSKKYHGSDEDPIFGDIEDSRYGVSADYAELILLHYFKGDSQQVTTGYTTITIYAYSVYYERSEHDKDLGGIEVPAPLENVPVTYTVPTEIVEDNDKKLNIQVTTIQQKLEPPLSYLLQGGVEPATGLNQIQIRANVTLFAKDGAGNELQPKTCGLDIPYTDYTSEGK